MISSVLALPHLWLLLIGIVWAGLSVYFFEKAQKPLSRFFMLLAGFCIASWSAWLDPFLWLWDEQFHALVARNMLQHPLKPTLIENPTLPYHINEWTGNHVWVHKQPLFMWQMAASMELFGINEFAVRFPSVIMHCLLPLFIWGLGKRFANERTGFYGGLLYLFSVYALEKVNGSNATEHNDLAFLFYVTASFWALSVFHEKQNLKWAAIVGVLAGCAVLCKWLTGMLVFGAWGIGLLVEHKWKLKDILLFVVGLVASACVFMPWQLYASHMYPAEYAHEIAYNKLHITQVIEGHDGDGKWYFHFLQIQDFFGYWPGIGWVVGLLTLYFLLKIKNGAYKAWASVWLIAIFGFFTLAKTKMPSYCFVSVPIGFLAIGYIIAMLQNARMRYVLTALACFLMFDIFKFGGLRKADNQFVADRKKVAEVGRKMNTKLKGTNTIFMPWWGQGAHIMFYTGISCYEFIPSEKQLSECLQKGSVVVVSNDTLPMHITSNFAVKTYRIEDFMD